MTDHPQTPQERLATDYRQRTALLRAWVVLLLSGWLFVWLLITVNDVKYLGTAEEWQPALSRGQLLPFGITLMVLTTIALIPLISSRAGAWTQVPKSMDRARLGGSAAIVATAGIALVGLLVAGAGLVHTCDEIRFGVDACNSARRTNLNLGSTFLLSGLGSLVLAAILRARLARVRRALVGGAAAAFPVMPARPVTPGGSAAPDLTAQLSQLSALHAAGHLTAQEFDAAKQRLLGGEGGQEPSGPGGGGRDPDGSGVSQPAPEPGVPVGTPPGTDLPVLPSTESNILGTLSMAVGIASLPLCLATRFSLGIPGLVAGFVAVLLGVVSIQRFREGRASNRAQAITGLVCGTIGVFASTVLLAVYLLTA